MKNVAKPKKYRATEDSGASMYVAHEKIHAREISGRFQTLRKLAVFVLLGLYYFLPWLNWNGRQAVLFDLPERQFHVFGLTFWPQDFFFLALLLIIAALSLFFFTALAGRLWCGYACPQTVWTEVFVWMERLAEGKRNQRVRLDAGPWNREKILRKTAKHGMWVLFALWTGFTFVGYFTPIETLGLRLLDFNLGPWEAFWIFFYGFATWGNAGFLREQVCMYMCPYARFQSAMFDSNTLIIAYDTERGEPRGLRRKAVPDVATREKLFASIKVEHSAPAEAKLDFPPPEALGDCVDCNLCVQVCPVGIDIRDGLQYECIACAACIDACDSVMDKMGYPRGLIRYDTQNGMEKKPSRILRPRTLIYGALLLALMGAWIAGVTLRQPVAMDVLRDRNALYRVVNDNVENVYTLKIMNKGNAGQRYRLSVEGIDAELVVEREAATRPGEVLSLPVRIQAGLGTVAGGGHDIAFVLETEDGARIVEKSRFFAPGEMQ